MELKSMQCQPCRGDSVAIAPDAYNIYLQQLPGWQISVSATDIPTLSKVFEFTNYIQCLAFVQEVGAIAEEFDHHPEMTISWGKVEICWWTHTIKGLHLNDFILAAKCDETAEAFYVNY